MVQFGSELSYRAVTVPPMSQTSRLHPAPSAPKSCLCDPQHDSLKSCLTAFASKPLGLRYTEFEHRSRTFHPRIQPALQELTVGDEGHAIRSFENFGSPHKEVESDEEVPDLSFLDDFQVRDSESPSGSLNQPRTPSPGNSNPGFRGRPGVSHDAPVVIKDDSSDDEADSERVSVAATPVQYRFRNRAVKPAVVREGTDGLWVAGPLITSFERGRTVPTALADGDYYPVRRITGERIRPGSNEYRVEWLGYNGQSDWVSAHECKCADLIADFHALETEPLLNAGRIEEAEKLQRLAKAEPAEIDNAVLPKHPGWRFQRRTAEGRFASRGASNSVVEILRMPTAPPEVRANTARRLRLQRTENPLDDYGASEKDEVEWLYTLLREDRSSVKLIKQSEDDGIRFLPYRDNNALEQAEMKRRRKEDAEGERRSAMKAAKKAVKKAAKKAADKEWRRLAKAHRKAARRDRRSESLRQERERAESQMQEEAEMRGAERAESERKRVEKEERKKWKAKMLEETVRRASRPNLIGNECMEEEKPPPNNKKRRIHQTLAGASTPAVRHENARFGASMVNEARASSVASTATINTRFRKARADEASKKAKNMPSHIRSEFRERLGEVQAQAMIRRTRIVPHQHQRLI